MSCDLELDEIFTFAHRVGLNFQNSSLLLPVLCVEQGLRECLVVAHHKLAEFDSGFANQLLFFLRLHMPHLKPQIEIFVEDVLHVKVLYPLRIQIVVDYLGLSYFDPTGQVLVANTRLHGAHRVRNCEEVQVIQF
jgi:hypothetical protein